MNLCKKINQLLVLYAEDELLQQERESVEAHLQHCSKCQLELEKYKKLQAGLTGEKIEIPASYSSELIVNLNNRLQTQKFTGKKLVPAVSFALVVLLVLLALFPGKNTNVDNKIFTEEYLLYRQYAGYSLDREIYKETEAMAAQLMPEEFYEVSREYVLENSPEYTPVYTEILSEMDDDSFEKIMENLKDLNI
jgi:hypothetical protein